MSRTGHHQAGAAPKSGSSRFLRDLSCFVLGGIAVAILDNVLRSNVFMVANLVPHHWASATGSALDPQQKVRVVPVVDSRLNFTAPDVRNHLGYLLEDLKFKDGVEIGVQRGRFASIHILPRWKSCRSYTLVDLWGHLDNYVDGANVGKREQQNIYNEAQRRLRPFENITTFMRMLSSEAAAKINDTSLDFVYVDARHDYCGAKEDMFLYWPKLRPGGLMAGHDFVYASEVVGDVGGNWSMCGDGSVHPRSCSRSSRGICNREWPHHSDHQRNARDVDVSETIGLRIECIFVVQECTSCKRELQLNDIICLATICCTLHVVSCLVRSLLIACTTLLLYSTASRSCPHQEVLL